jgi:Holliday junction resolvase
VYDEIGVTMSSKKSIKFKRNLCLVDVDELEDGGLLAERLAESFVVLGSQPDVMSIKKRNHIMINLTSHPTCPIKIHTYR